MNPFNYIFHPYFVIPLFLLLGLVIFLAPFYAKNYKVKLVVWIFLGLVLVIVVVPNFVAVAIWFLVSKLHWIR